MLPSGTRPWMPGSRLPPDTQFARGVATSGGSGLRLQRRLRGLLALTLAEHEQVVQLWQLTGRAQDRQRQEQAEQHQWQHR